MLKSISKNKFKKTVIAFLILFLLTFAARSAYELVFTGRDVIVTYDPGMSYSGMMYESYGKQSNVASERVVQKDLYGQSVSFDQKYEKTANIVATSERFTDDNKSLRRIIEENNAVIQMENLRGLPGRQTLDMTIGVMPDSFDAVVEFIQSIGQLKSFDVNKVDKTNEYRELMAQMETFQKTLDSYTEMKRRGGDIKDLLLLEDKILDIQDKIQTLGVNIGVFSTENSFCTVNFSMREVTVAVTEISVRFVMTCVKDAFFWTITLYLLLFIVSVGGLFAVWILLFAYQGVKDRIPRKAGSTEENNEEHKQT